jgi:hypothetical protein
VSANLPPAVSIVSLMVNSSDAAVEALLAEEKVALAASIFVAAFTGVGLGRELDRAQVDKELYRRFGKPRGDANYAYKAVVFEIVLIWERARIAVRAYSSMLFLLPDGVRLLDSKDVAGGLRALL